MPGGSSVIEKAGDITQYIIERLLGTALVLLWIHFAGMLLGRGALQFIIEWGEPVMYIAWYVTYFYLSENIPKLFFVIFASYTVYQVAEFVIAAW